MFVLPPPAFDQDLCFRQRKEDLPVQQLIAQLPIERFHIAVLPRTAGLDEQRLDGQGVEPQAHELRRKLGTVVGADVRRDPVGQKERRQRLEYLDGPQPPRHHQRQTLARILLDDRQDLQGAPVVRARRHEVIRPHVVPIRRAAADARPVGEPQPASFGLFLRDFQAFSPPQPLDPLVIHAPAFSPQQPRDPSIPIPSILRRQGDDPLHQPRLIRRHPRPMALGGPGVPEHPASPPLGDA